MNHVRFLRTPSFPFFSLYSGTVRRKGMGSVGGGMARQRPLLSGVVTSPPLPFPPLRSKDSKTGFALESCNFQTRNISEHFWSRSKGKGTSFQTRSRHVLKCFTFRSYSSKIDLVIAGEWRVIEVEVRIKSMALNAVYPSLLVPSCYPSSRDICHQIRSWL